MNNSDSDQLLHELETHVERILEHHGAQDSSVTDNRGGLVNALTRFVDQRIREHLKKYDEHVSA
jgi:hypothetical protein